MNLSALLILHNPGQFYAKHKPLDYYMTGLRYTFLNQRHSSVGSNEGIKIADETYIALLT